MYSCEMFRQVEEKKSQLILGKLQGWEKEERLRLLFLFSSTTKENACGKWKKKRGGE